MEPDEVREFVEPYLREATERASCMIAANDPAILGADAHALFGMSGNVGAIRVGELAKSVELACKQGDIEAARVSLKPLGATADALTTWAQAQRAVRIVEPNAR